MERQFLLSRESRNHCWMRGGGSYLQFILRQLMDSLNNRSFRKVTTRATYDEDETMLIKSCGKLDVAGKSLLQDDIASAN